jgi:hypothetical protein
MATTASDSASASGTIKAESQDSKAYSAVKSTSSDGDVYSYLSSNGLLTSIISGKANDHVSEDQSLNAQGNVLVYASSTSEDSSSKSYAANGNAVSGRISASAGSPAVIDNNIKGDVQSTSSNLVPTPGSWAWKGYGGYINTDPFMITDAQGRSHILAAGGDNGLWDNIDGNWYSLGGVITSDPYAVKDQQSNLHILCQGGDGALWDNVFNTQSWTADWHGLGGCITLDPSAAVEPWQDGWVVIAARGLDGSLWLKDINPKDMSSNPWQSAGGYIKSSPYLVFDNQGKMQTLVRGGDDALWINTGTPTSGGYQIAWKSQGGVITSAAKPLLDPQWGTLDIFARGSDGKLWVDTLDTQSGIGRWNGLNAGISPAGSGSPIYEGNPEPVADNDGNIHVFLRGNDGSLQDALGTYDPNQDVRNYYSYGLGGYITSDPSAIAGNGVKIATRGGDGSLWVNTIT